MDEPTPQSPDDSRYAALLARRRKAAHILALVAIAVVIVVLVLGALQARRYDRCMQDLDCTEGNQTQSAPRFPPHL